MLRVTRSLAFDGANARQPTNLTLCVDAHAQDFVHACDGAPDTDHRRDLLGLDISDVDNRGLRSTNPGTSAGLAISRLLFMFGTPYECSNRSNPVLYSIK